MSSRRLFIAITLPKKIKQVLAEVEKALKNKLGKKSVKWIEKDNLHQTMIFLGNVKDKRVGLLNQMLTDLSQNPCLKLTFKRIGFFPDQRRPRLIWAEIGGETTRLSCYYHQLRLALEKEGFDFDTRFSPHITLGRVRVNRGKIFLSKRAYERINQMIRSQDTSFIVKQVVLFQSRLTPKGPVYTPVTKVKLTSLSRLF